MIIILLGAIFGVINVNYMIYEKGETPFFLHFIMSIVGACLGLVAGYFVAAILPMETYTKEYSYSIETLQDNNNTHGNFFLGSGQIDNKMHYVLYYEDSGFYKMMQLPYDEVSIKYSEGRPKLIVLKNCAIENSMINNFAVDMDLGYKNYIVEVPKGTILNNYALDAK